MLITGPDAGEVQPTIRPSREADVYRHIICLGRDLDGLHMHKPHHLLHIRYLHLKGLPSIAHRLRGTEMYVKREIGKGSHNAVVLAEGEFVSELFQATEFPSHWEHGLVMKVQDVGLLLVQDDLLELYKLLVHLEVRLGTIGTDLEANWDGILLHTADQSVVKLARGLGIGPQSQRLEGEQKKRVF